MAIKDRRKVFMDYLDSILNTLDPSGANSKLYHEKFDKMSDNQFDSYIKRFFEDDKQTITHILENSDIMDKFYKKKIYYPKTCKYKHDKIHKERILYDYN